MCCPLVFEFSVGIGGFVIGLGQISFFLSSTNTLLATKFPTDFNSTHLCFPTNCSQCCYIDTLFFKMCHTLRTRLYTQIPMHMSSVDLYKGQVSLASR